MSSRELGGQRKRNISSIDQFDKAFKLDLDFRGKLFDTPTNPAFSIDQLKFSTLKTQRDSLPNLREPPRRRRVKTKRKRPQVERVTRRLPLARKPLPKPQQEVKV